MGPEVERHVVFDHFLEETHLLVGLVDAVLIDAAAQEGVVAGRESQSFLSLDSDFSLESGEELVARLVEEHHVVRIVHEQVEVR